jgi:hypothetical protein
MTIEMPLFHIYIQGLDLPHDDFALTQAWPAR